MSSLSRDYVCLGIILMKYSRRQKYWCTQKAIKILSLLHFFIAPHMFSPLISLILLVNAFFSLFISISYRSSNFVTKQRRLRAITLQGVIEKLISHLRYTKPILFLPTVRMMSAYEMSLMK